MRGIYHLNGTVKHYDWGGFSFIPWLLQQVNAGERPFAEYWLGIHPLGTSIIEDGAEGKKVSEQLPDLSFLLKILDVRDMLSIQVHPSKESALFEFERENNEGIALASPLRNYKDPNHKPELMVALSDFWLLHGFKPEKELVYTLLNVVELRELLPVFNLSGYEGLYRHVMYMSQDEVNRILQPLLDNLKEIYRDTEPDKDDEDYWVSKASRYFTPGGNIDRGIFSIYFFNLIHMKRGEGIYQAAGVPHAYLEGQNVEVMANSDNVLRGGLTNKHIAVDELMKHISFEAVYPEIISGESAGPVERSYKTPADDFNLSVFELEAGQSTQFVSTGSDILLLTEGEVAIKSNDSSLQLNPGHPAAIVLETETIQISTIAGVTLFRAFGR